MERPVRRLRGPPGGGAGVTLGFRDGFCDGPQARRPAAGRRRGRGRGRRAEVVDRKAAGLSDDVRAKLAAAAPWAFWKLSDRTLEVTLDRDPPFPVGRSVYCPDRMGAGFVFRKNMIRSPGRERC